MRPENKETVYYLRRGGLVALVFIIILAAFGSFMAGKELVPPVTSTVAETTLTSISTTTFSNISSFMVTSYIVRTETTFSTIGVTLPLHVTVSGNASSKTIGTSASSIHFVSTGGTDFSAPIQNGRYTALLLNSQDYNVYIDYAGPVGGVGSGRCLAGGLPFGGGEVGLSVNANWSC